MRFSASFVKSHVFLLKVDAETKHVLMNNSFSVVFLHCGVIQFWFKLKSNSSSDLG